MIELLAIMGDFKKDKEGAAWFKLIVDSSQANLAVKIPTEKLLKVTIEESE